MKVCLYVGSHPPYTGGGQTFIDEICKALAKKLRPPSSWQPCLAGEDPGWGARAKDLGLRFVRVPKRLSGRRWMKILPAVDRADRRAGFLHEHGFAGVLNLSPMEWIDLDTPYVQVVWDLQHRLQPWFPEVSYHGEWERRETAYRSVLPRASFVVTGTRAGNPNCFDSTVWSLILSGSSLCPRQGMFLIIRKRRTFPRRTTPYPTFFILPNSGATRITVFCWRQCTSSAKGITVTCA